MATETARRYATSFLKPSGGRVLVWMDLAHATEVRVQVIDAEVDFVLEAAASENGLFELRVSAAAWDQALNPRQAALTRLTRLVEPWLELARELQSTADLQVQENMTHPSLDAAVARARAALTRSTRRPGTRARGEAKAALLSRVAEEYKQALDAGSRQPRKVIAARLGYTPEHIGRLLVQARRTVPPLLGSAVPGRAGEA